MKLLETVVDELYTFVLESTQSGITYSTSLFAETKITNRANESHNSTVETEDFESEEPPTFKQLSALLEGRYSGETTGGDAITSSSLSHEVMYVGSGEAPLFMRAVKEYDEILLRIPYGSMVLQTGMEGRFVQVSYQSQVGYVLRDDLADRASFVYPEFIVGQENGAEDPNTLRVRACIKDMFGGGETEYPLQAGEYIMYRLMRKGRVLPWDATRPRVPGRWHTLLPLSDSIQIDSIPRTGAIMESLLPGDVGHLAYVEAVFPDNTITISEVNYPAHGIYSERTLTKDEWQNDATHFIHVL